MPIEKNPALGWQNCARISNAHAQLLVTLDVGPRILGYSAPGGVNVLRALDGELGTSGENKFVGRGGHRLWVSPENDRTYAPDNSPVKFEIGDDFTLHVENPAAAPWHVRKEMTISLAPDSSRTTIQHRITNEGSEPIEIASWALTVMTPGGIEIVPQPPLGEHGPDSFLPNRVIVPWTYTDLSDDRWRIGRKFITLTPKPGRPATKLGLLHLDKWIGYALPGAFFVKTVELHHGGAYPDLGCNFETFSKSDFIELETLSTIKKLAPGESIGHSETWQLFADAKLPASLEDEALAEWLAPYLPHIAKL